MFLYPFGLSNLFNLFSHTLYVGDQNGEVHIVAVSVVVDCRTVAVVVALASLVVSEEPVLKLS